MILRLRLVSPSVDLHHSLNSPTSLLQHGSNRRSPYRRWHFHQGAAPGKPLYTHHFLTRSLAHSPQQPAVLKSDTLSLKAIFSRSLASAQSTADLIPSLAASGSAPSPDLYSADAGAGKTYHDLLLRDDIHAVIIALPILSQPEYIEAALTAGKHVLAEKPIAADVAAARKLIDFAATKATNGATLAIAENFRFTPSFVYAHAEGAKLGRVTHFSIRVFGHMKSDTKWYKTEWRAKPGYQGGFLLDGGVHHAAASRLFLQGEHNAAATVQAFTDLVQPHLPPIDTVNAIIKTRSGASGSFQHSAGTHLRAFEWEIGYEKGTLKAAGETVTVTPAEGEPVVKEFTRTTGVAEEVVAWAAAIAEGKPNSLQSAEEALADLEFLEKMFKSGEEGGATQTYEFQ